MAAKAEPTTAEQTEDAATEHTNEPQLAELVTQEAGLSYEIELKVVRRDLVHYEYKYNGKDVSSQKVQRVLCCLRNSSYCPYPSMSNAWSDCIPDGLYYKTKSMPTRVRFTGYSAPYPNGTYLGTIDACTYVGPVIAKTKAGEYTVVLIGGWWINVSKEEHSPKKTTHFAYKVAKNEILRWYDSGWRDGVGDYL